MTESAQTRTPWNPGRWAAIAAGLVVTGGGLAVAELLASLGSRTGLLSQFSSPVLALGATFITLTPEWLKSFAISTFGLYDKVALQVGMVLTIAAAAAIIGLVARRSPRAAAGVLAALLIVCAVAVMTRPVSAGIIDLIPTVLGGVAAVVLLGKIFSRTAVLPDRPPHGLDRRQFFRLVGVTAAVGVVAGSLSRFLPNSADVEASRAAQRIPTAAAQQFAAGVDLTSIEAAVPGQPPFLTPNDSFYRIDTALALPDLTAQDWRLRIHGLVDTEISLDYTELQSRPQIDRTITLTCVSNEVGGDLAGTATWTGSLLKPLLEQAGPQAGADCVLCTSADGFTLTAPLEALTDGRDAMLALAMNGEILPHRHGFPVRMVVPGLYGYVSATKWVVDMKVSRFADEVAYWTARGWSAEGPIKTASRIDVPKGFTTAAIGDEIVVAGVAWAQGRGIEAVELQIDDGPWEPVTMSAALSDDTWRQWRTTWTATTPGVHTLRCRAIDGSGALQDERIAAPIPDGATGYDSRSITVG